MLAFPAGASTFNTTFEPGNAYMRLTGIDEKVLYYRKPYSSVAQVKNYLTFGKDSSNVQVVDKGHIIDLTDRLNADGTLTWNVPDGKWTVMRFGTRNNGAVTRPAPLA